MSERNGDKARFQKQRKHKLLHRTRIRELRKALGHDNASKDTPVISPAPLAIASFQTDPDREEQLAAK